MANSIALHNLVYAIVFLVGTLALFVVFAAVCHFVAARRASQSMEVFLTRFAVAFAFLYLLELAVLVVWPSVPRALAGGMASLVGGILSFAGVSHSVSGWTVALQSSSLSFDIGWGCLGGELFWSYIALVFAETAATRKQRLMGILVGLAILLAFNFFRITLSIYVEGQTGFNIHYLFYYINIAFVLVVWLGWLRTIRRRPARLAGAMS